MKKIIRIYCIAACLWGCTPEKGKNKSGEISKDFCSSIHIEDAGNLSKELDSLTKNMDTKTGVYVLEEGDASMAARAWLCENAERSIDVQYFIFAADNVGLIAADYLVRAADRGVKVRLLVDDVMVEADEEKLLVLDSHENITIKIYNSVLNIGKNTAEKLVMLKENFAGANQRMHNKTFTVDGKVVITGGRNIADEYFDYDHEYNFRDRDVLLVGKVVSNITGSFEEYWNSSLSKEVTEVADVTNFKPDSDKPFESLHNYACDSTNFWPQVRDRIRNVPNTFAEIKASGKFRWVDSVVFISDKPGKKNHYDKNSLSVTTDSLMSLIRRAKRSIVIQSPYLVTTDIGKKLISETIKRGVSVKILTNSLGSTDNLPAFSGYQRDRKALLMSGLKIYEFRPDAEVRYRLMTGALQKKIAHSPVFGIHAKTMIIDEMIAVIGTFNFDPRSANLNTECVTVIYSEVIAKEVQKGIEEEMLPANAWEATLEFNPDTKASLNKRIKVAPMRVIPKDIL